jgi:hypothetical protein
MATGEVCPEDCAITVKPVIFRRSWWTWRRKEAGTLENLRNMRRILAGFRTKHAAERVKRHWSRSRGCPRTGPSCREVQFAKFAPITHRRGQPLSATGIPYIRHEVHPDSVLITLRGLPSGGATTPGSLIREVYSYHPSSRTAPVGYWHTVCPPRSSPGLSSDHRAGAALGRGRHAGKSNSRSLLLSPIVEGSPCRLPAYRPSATKFIRTQF